MGENRVIVAPSCSLLHVPVDLDSETQIDKEIKSWLCFAKQKLIEVDAIKQAVCGNLDEAKKTLENNCFKSMMTLNKKKILVKFCLQVLGEYAEKNRDGGVCYSAAHSRNFSRSKIVISLPSTLIKSFL